jgi:hypothetical protein
METVSYIHRYNSDRILNINIDEIYDLKNTLSKTYSTTDLNSKMITKINNISKKIISGDSDEFSRMILFAYHLHNTTSTKYSFSEMLPCVNKIVDEFNNILDGKLNNTTLGDDFYNLMDEFYGMYKFRVDKYFSELLIHSRKASQILCYCKLKSINKHDKEKLLNQLDEEISEMYSVHKIATIQFILTNSNILYELNQLDKFWNLVTKSLLKDEYNTIYIIIAELRKLSIKQSDDPKIKLMLYYDVDIDGIKSEFRFSIINMQKIVEVINLFYKSRNLCTKINTISLIDSLDHFKKLFIGLYVKTT